MDRDKLGEDKIRKGLLEKYANRPIQELEQYDCFLNQEGDSYMHPDKDKDCLFFGLVKECRGFDGIRVAFPEGIKVNDVLRALKKIADFVVWQHTEGRERLKQIEESIAEHVRELAADPSKHIGESKMIAEESGTNVNKKYSVAEQEYMEKNLFHLPPVPNYIQQNEQWINEMYRNIADVDNILDAFTEGSQSQGPLTPEQKSNVRSLIASASDWQKWAERL